jgi:hypothetical protein
MSGRTLRGPAVRNLVAALLTGVLALAAAALVLAGWEWVAGGPLGAAAWFAATVAVAVVVPLTRPWAERGAERLVFGADGDPYAVLARFVDEVSEAIAVDDVLPQLARAAAAATHSPSGQASVRLADGDVFRQTWPPQVTRIPEEVTVPLEHGGRVVGELGVQAGREVADEDRAQLERFSGPAGLALANVGLTFDLRRQLAEEQALLRQLRGSRQRLLTAAADQRARFGSDVRRDVLPQIGCAHRALQDVGAGDVDAIATARACARQALDALRQLASGVYQVALHERGLVAALERLQDGVPALRWAAGPPDLPRLPRGVEEAAYFAVLAVAGGEQPAGTSTELALRLDDGRDARRPRGLRIALTGPHPPQPQSVQLARDRAEAVGGSLSGGGGSELDLVLWLPADGDPAAATAGQGVAP